MSTVMCAVCGGQLEQPLQVLFYHSDSRMGPLYGVGSVTAVYADTSHGIYYYAMLSCSSACELLCGLLKENAASLLLVVARLRPIVMIQY